MPPATHVLTLPAPMLHRGFWLYVWRGETPEGWSAPVMTIQLSSSLALR